MKKLVNVEKYEEGKEYECDVFIRNSVWGVVPKNIKAKKYAEMRHANYKFLLDKNQLYTQWHPMEEIQDIIACGDFVNEMSRLVMKDEPITIKNILLPNRDIKKVLRLISCTRLDPQKGWNRMLTMCDMLRKEGIPFTWDVFTNSLDYKSPYEELRIWKQRDDIFDYVANADYSVLLSDSEGLPYTIQESLQYKTPCIVSDVGGCTELIKEGINGYIVPLDMNFDIKKILKIPKCEEYDNHALEDWLKYLEIDYTKEDIEKARTRKDVETMLKVRALEDFTRITDTDVNRERAIGEEWEITEDRYNTIKEYEKVKELHLIELVEEPKEVEEAKEEVIDEKPKKRKTTKK